jgi:hypothetical protein
MTYFLGNVGNVRLRRKVNAVTLSAVVKTADIVTTLNRVGCRRTAADNLLTGDRVTISVQPTVPWAAVYLRHRKLVTDGDGVTYKAAFQCVRQRQRCRRPYGSFPVICSGRQ